MQVFQMGLSVHTTEEAVASLLQGGVGVLPTDTVYGLAARAADVAAVRRLYRLKQREHKPGTVIAASADQLARLGIAPAYLDQVRHLWPGPVSVVLPAGDELAYLHQDLASLAVRVPVDASVRALLRQTGPLVTSSANQPGRPEAANIEQAYAYFGAAVDFYVDGGNMTGRTPSTVARLTDDGLQLLRRGAVLPKGLHH